MRLFKPQPAYSQFLSISNPPFMNFCLINSAFLLQTIQGILRNFGMDYKCRGKAVKTMAETGGTGKVEKR